MDRKLVVTELSFMMTCQINIAKKKKKKRKKNGRLRIYVVLDFFPSQRIILRKNQEINKKIIRK